MSPAPTVTPAPTATVPLLACDFDSFLRPACGFDYTADYDWTRQSGSTPAWATGPSSDHTSGSGSFMYIDAYGDWPDYTQNYPNVGPFTLSSPSFTECVGEVTFFYHMYSYYADQYDSSSWYGYASGYNDYYSPGTLQLEETTDGVSWATIWTKSGNHGDVWQGATVSVSMHVRQVRHPTSALEATPREPSAPAHMPPHQGADVTLVSNSTDGARG